MKCALRSTTAIVASLALALPLPVTGQTVTLEDGTVIECMEDSTDAACIEARVDTAVDTVGDVISETEDAISETVEEVGDVVEIPSDEADPAAEFAPETADPAVETTVETEAPIPDTDGDAEVVAEPVATPLEPEVADPIVEPDFADTAPPEPDTGAADATAESEPLEPVTTTDPVDPGPVDPALTDPDFDADIALEPEVDPVAPEVVDTDADIALEPEVDPVTPEVLDTEADIALEPEAVPVTPEVIETEPDIALEPEVDPASPEMVETQPDVAIDAGTDVVPATEIDVATETAPEAEIMDAEAADLEETAAEVTEVAPDAPTQAAIEAAEGEAAEVLAVTDPEASNVVEEVSEILTEETTRSSDEEFGATGTESATAQQESGSGLGTLERALIGAAGALAVGAILSGNREVVSQSGDRVVVRDPTGGLQVLRDDNAILRQPGSEVSTQSFADGSSRQTVLQPDGSRIVTIRDPELRVLRRTVITPDGREVVLFDDTVAVQAVDMTDLPDTREPVSAIETTDRDALRAALLQQANAGRSFSLSQVRQIDRVRYLAPAISVDSVNFATDSAAIQPGQAEELFTLGQFMTEMIEENPAEVFLIEGHTDAVGSAAYNLALSDRRAESVALALTEYFGVSPANMVLQGYGESDLRVPTMEAERANRRVVVRRITPLL